MATGGVFQLITNDGKQDRMLMATQMLRARLDAIRGKRRADPSLGDETPTLLDIERTHVLFTNAHFKPFVALGYEYNKVNTQAGSVTLGSEVQFSIPQFGDFFSDMVLYVTIDAPTVTTSDTGANAPTVRWCEKPGVRLLKKVSFDVNGNPLDTYTSDSTLMHDKFLVQPNKRTGWNKCIGQQRPLKGWFTPTTAGAPDAARTWVEVTNGAQTPKAAADSLSLFIPLLFWCNQDPRLAVPSVAIPYGQRFIAITLESAANLVALQLRGSGVTSSLSTPNISNMSLYINNIFVNPEIHKIFIKRIGFTLIRVHRYQTIACAVSEQEILLQNLKWPIETIFAGMRLASQKTDMAKWDKFTQVTDTSFSVPRLLDTSSTLTTATVTAFGSPYAVTASGTTATAVAPVNVKLIDRITVSAHGIYLYNDIPADFFNAYTTYTYGGVNIATPEDEGVLMIPFSLYPGTYQPSGHVNISRAREFKYRIQYVQKYVLVALMA